MEAKNPRPENADGGNHFGTQVYNSLSFALPSQPIRGTPAGSSQRDPAPWAAGTTSPTSTSSSFTRPPTITHRNAASLASP